MDPLVQLRDFISSNPILSASLSSLWGAVLVDLLAFKNVKDPGPWVEQFSFKVAMWRYLQAFVGGFVGNAVVAAGAGVVTLVLFWTW